MGCFNISFISMRDKALAKAFQSAGLESRMVQISNGSTIHVWVPKGYTTPPADKPVVLFLHGFGASAVWQWELQVKPFLQHYTVILPDLIFHGKSTTESPKRSESFQAESMVMCLNSLGIQKFNVVGTSYGGFVSYRIAQNHPDAVLKMVLSNSAILMTAEDDKALCKRGGAETIPELLLPAKEESVHRMLNLVFKNNPFSWCPNFVVRDYIITLHTPHREEKMEMLEALCFGKENAPSMMTKVDKDVLIVWGDSDKIFLPEQAQRIKEYLGKRAELEILENAGHASQMEQSAKWNKLVLDFFERK